MVDRLNVLVLQVLTRASREEQGQSMAEYAMILALVAVVVAGAVTLLGTGLSTKFGNVTSSL